MKKTAAIITAVIIVICLPLSCMAGAAAEALPDIYSVSYGEAFEGPEAVVEEGTVYISDPERGASALYISGGEHVFNDLFVYGAGFGTEEDLSAERSSQYGYCADVLVNGADSVVTLNSPMIMSDPESHANGVFAAAMAKIYVNGGIILTNNAQGHGADATYMGHVYLRDTVIHTAGSASGSLATDYGGGFITAENVDCTTELRGSPGIYCAGSSIIICKDSTFNALNCEGVMSAHDHGITVLENCDVFGETSALNGHQALPSPSMSSGSYCFVFGGTLRSGSGPVVKEGNGRTETTIIGAKCIPGEGANVIEADDGSGGILTVNLWDTELTGNVYCGDGASVTVNIYEGGSLTGEVLGTGEMVINVYPGGTYNGSYAAFTFPEKADRPEPGDFDYYLVNYWAAGMQKWSGSTITTYISDVQPVIIENSAFSIVKDGAAEIPYDPAKTDISENGVDPDLLDTAGATGFGEPGQGGGSGGPDGGGGQPQGPGGPDGEGGQP